MDEFDQEGVGQDDEYDQSAATPGVADEEAPAGAVEPEAAADGGPEEPEAPDEPTLEEPEAPDDLTLEEPTAEQPASATVQESMTFDDIVASAAAGATAAPVATEGTGEVSADEAAGETASGETGAIGSEELDDMVEALKDGAAAKTAEGEEPAEGETPVAETADDEVIAEEAEVEEEAYEEIEDEYAGVALVRNRLGAKLPAWAYAGVWVVFVGVMTYLLWPVAAKSFVQQPDYAYMVIGGLALTVAGPIVALLTWVFSRMGTTASERIGLVRAVWMRCMLAEVFGVAVWWLALYALDMHRKGLIG